MTYYEEQLCIFRDSLLPPAHQINKVVAAKHYIERHLGADIQISAIAGSACLSEFHFIRLFKKCYGRTPHQFLVDCRIETAKLLLQSGTTVTVTCFSVGFSSITSFTALFKKYTGYTPARYRQKEQF